MMSGVVAEKIIEMFIIMIGGFIAYKTKLIDSSTTKKMSDLLLMLISPLLIFNRIRLILIWNILSGCSGRSLHPALPL